MPVESLLFQTGYLTIKKITTIGTQYAYVLTYPNLEVKASLNGALASIASNLMVKNQHLTLIAKALQNNEFQHLQRIFNSHFSSIPNDWYRNNNIGQYEGFYASIVYSFFVALGYDTIPEDVTNRGRIDLTLIMHDKILIIEFKLKKFGDANKAIMQIKEKGYPDKYVSYHKPIYLIGISFDTIERNVTELKVEQYENSKNRFSQ